MRLKQYSKTQPCYYCGAHPPSTQEHAPPKLMFSAFECDSITVPSCIEHNNGKSDKDRAIVTALLKSLYRTLECDIPSNSFSPDVIKAIEHLKPNFAQANREVKDNSLLIDPELDFKIPAIGVSVDGWIRQLSAALVWSVSGEFDSTIKWDEALVWNSFYLRTSRPMELLDIGWQVVMNQAAERSIERFDWKGGWSAYPRMYPSNIYNLSICFSPTLVQVIENEVAFRHQFYNCLNWYIWFAPSKKTRMVLEEAVARLNFE
jgi:hypothetical protein